MNYKFILTLKNLLQTDVRRYKIEATLIPKPTKALLEFRIPVRNSTV